ncbi:hypothetical protein D3C71_2121100 [compost metagenome]
MLVGRTDVDHPLLIPVERPEHRIDAAKQRAEQVLALTQALDFGAAVQQRQGELFEFQRKKGFLVH